MEFDVKTQYNKTILMNPIEKLSEKDDKKDFDLCFYVYQGKLTTIVEKFNHQQITDSKKLVKDSFADKNRSPLQIAAFLNFFNIFLYLLTFDADSGKIDDNQQSTWHILGYRGHTRIMGILLNHIRYKLKQRSLEKIDSIKKEYGFSDLDIVKGKLSKAVYLTEVNIHKFNELQKKVENEANKLITDFIELLEKYLSAKDKNGQTPLHLAAMSKFSLSHEIINQILEFNFFKLDESWDDYLSLFSELQSLEIKKERMNQDPRRAQRIERELYTLLGEKKIKNDLTKYYNKMKRDMLKKLINIEDNNGDTLLHICSFHGNYKIINRLIYYGGNKNLENKENKKPVVIAKDNIVRNVLTNLNETATKASNEKDVIDLVILGNDINEKLSIFSLAPIHKVLENKNDKKHEILNEMLLWESDPNMKDSNGWTALHYACQYGDLQSVKILIEKGADKNAFSNNKRTPLHLAAKMNRLEIVNYLIDQILKGSGINKKYLDVKDDHGCTPTHLAAKEGNTKCLESLLLKGADLYAVDLCGWNILHYASFHANKDTIRFICRYDADYDILQKTKNSQNKMPIEILSNYNLKPYFITLWHAAREGDLNNTQRLIENESENKNEPTFFEKNTPLHLAVLNNHYSEARLLLSRYHADPNLKNKYDALPIDYANKMPKLFKEKSKKLKEIDKDIIDLRDILKEIFKKTIKKSDDFVNSTVCEKNHKINIKSAIEINSKIINLLKNK